MGKGPKSKTSANWKGPEQSALPCGGCFVFQAANAAANGAPVHPEAARLVAAFFQRLAQSSREWEGLSAREREVFHLLARGFLKKEIAERLGISVETVRTHCAHIYEKLHVRCRADAVAKVVPSGLPPATTRLEASEAARLPDS
jgi:DNA-binding NarL/FixJ family response regulator